MKTELIPVNRKESMQKLREELLAVEEERLAGARYFSVDETMEMMELAIRPSPPCISTRHNI